MSFIENCEKFGFFKRQEMLKVYWPVISNKLTNQGRIIFSGTLFSDKY